MQDLFFDKEKQKKDQTEKKDGKSMLDDLLGGSSPKSPGSSSLFSDDLFFKSSAKGEETKSDGPSTDKAPTVEDAFSLMDQIAGKKPDIPPATVGGFDKLAWAQTPTSPGEPAPEAATPPEPAIPPQAAPEVTPPPAEPTLPPQAALDVATPPTEPAIPPQAAPEVTPPPAEPTLPPQAAPEVATPPAEPAIPPQAAPEVATPPAEPTIPPQVAPEVATPPAEPAIPPQAAPDVATPPAEPAIPPQAAPEVATPPAEPAIPPQAAPEVATPPTEPVQQEVQVPNFCIQLPGPATPENAQQAVQALASVVAQLQQFGMDTQFQQEKAVGIQQLFSQSQFDDVIKSVSEALQEGLGRVFLDCRNKLNECQQVKDIKQKEGFNTAPIDELLANLQKSLSENRFPDFRNQLVAFAQTAQQLPKTEAPKEEDGKKKEAEDKIAELKTLLMKKKKAKVDITKPRKMYNRARTFLKKNMIDKSISMSNRAIKTLGGKSSAKKSPAKKAPETKAKEAPEKTPGKGMKSLAERSRKVLVEMIELAKSTGIDVSNAQTRLTKVDSLIPKAKNDNHWKKVKGHAGAGRKVLIKNFNEGFENLFQMAQAALSQHANNPFLQIPKRLEELNKTKAELNAKKPQDAFKKIKATLDNLNGDLQLVTAITTALTQIQQRSEQVKATCPNIDLLPAQEGAQQVVLLLQAGEIKKASEQVGTVNNLLIGCEKKWKTDQVLASIQVFFQALAPHIQQHPEIQAPIQNTTEIFKGALDLYNAGNFNEALKKFAEISDALTQIYGLLGDTANLEKIAGLKNVIIAIIDEQSSLEVATPPTEPVVQPQVAPEVATPPVEQVVQPQAAPEVAIPPAEPEVQPQVAPEVAIPPAEPEVQPQAAPEVAIPPAQQVVQPQAAPEVAIPPAEPVVQPQAAPEVAIPPAEPVVQPQAAPEVATPPAQQVGQPQAAPEVAIPPAQQVVQPQAAPEVAIPPAEPVVQPQAAPEVATPPAQQVGQPQAAPEVATPPAQQAVQPQAAPEVATPPAQQVAQPIQQAVQPGVQQQAPVQQVGQGPQFGIQLTGPATPQHGEIAVKGLADVVMRLQKVGMTIEFQQSKSQAIQPAFAQGNFDQVVLLGNEAIQEGMTRLFTEAQEKLKKCGEILEKQKKAKYITKPLEERLTLIMGAMQQMQFDIVIAAFPEYEAVSNKLEKRPLTAKEKRSEANLKIKKLKSMINEAKRLKISVKKTTIVLTKAEEQYKSKKWNAAKKEAGKALLDLKTKVLAKIKPRAEKAREEFMQQINTAKESGIDITAQVPKLEKIESTYPNAKSVKQWKIIRSNSENGLKELIKPFQDSFNLLVQSTATKLMENSTNVFLQVPQRAQQIEAVRQTFNPAEPFNTYKQIWDFRKKFDTDLEKVSEISTGLTATQAKIEELKTTYDKINLNPAQQILQQIGGLLQSNDFEKAHEMIKSIDQILEQCIEKWKIQQILIETQSRYQTLQAKLGEKEEFKTLFQMVAAQIQDGVGSLGSGNIEGCKASFERVSNSLSQIEGKAKVIEGFDKLDELKKDIENLPKDETVDLTELNEYVEEAQGMLENELHKEALETVQKAYELIDVYNRLKKKSDLESEIEKVIGEIEEAKKMYPTADFSGAEMAHRKCSDLLDNNEYEQVELGIMGVREEILQAQKELALVEYNAIREELNGIYAERKTIDGVLSLIKEGERFIDEMKWDTLIIYFNFGSFLLNKKNPIILLKIFIFN